MLKPLNKEAAFEAIAEDLELPLVLLPSPDPRSGSSMLEQDRRRACELRT